MSIISRNVYNYRIDDRMHALVIFLISEIIAS